MAGILDALTDVTDALRGRGLNADSDPRNLNIPGVWVTLDHYAGDRLTPDAATVTVALTVIVPDAGTPATLAQLDELVDVIGVEFPGLGWEPRAVILPSQSPQPLPALTTTLTLDWRR